MKLIRFLILITLFAACEKSSDVGAMQDEANGIVNSYRARFDALAQRMKSLNDRGSKTLDARTVPDFEQIGRVFADTQRKLIEMQGLVKSAPTTIANKAKVENARSELIASMGTIRAQLENGHREINRNLDTVESWLAYVEHRPRTAPPAVAPPPTNPPPSPELRPDQQPPAPEGASGVPGAGSAAGSAAPVR